MPELAYPWALALLLVLPLVARRWRRRPRAVFRFSQIAALEKLPTGRSVAAERGGLWLRLIGLGLGIVALAGPRWPDEGSRIPTQGISLALVLDVSSSMAQRDFNWQGETISRLEGVKRVFRLLAQGGTGPDGTTFPGRSQDLMMIVAFATRPETICPLTLDHAALLTILDAEEPRTLITEATTNPGDAVAWALYALQKAPTRRKLIVLLTDGESNVPPPALKPRQAGQLAGNLGIPIYTIDAAPAGESAAAAGQDAALQGDALQGDAARARQVLQEVAKMTQGQYFHATDGDALTRALAGIDQLERDLIDSYRYRRYAEGYPWFALAALACWLVVLALEATRWRKAP
jgi:Ca-activated chloride channel family protein